jgi:hypothetical protein
VACIEYWDILQPQEEGEYSLNHPNEAVEDMAVTCFGIA